MAEGETPQDRLPIPVNEARGATQRWAAAAKKIIADYWEARQEEKGASVPSVAQLLRKLEQAVTVSVEAKSDDEWKNRMRKSPGITGAMVGAKEVIDNLLKYDKSMLDVPPEGVNAFLSRPELETVSKSLNFAITGIKQALGPGFKPVTKFEIVGTGMAHSQKLKTDMYEVRNSLASILRKQPGNETLEATDMNPARVRGE